MAEAAISELQLTFILLQKKQKRETLVLASHSTLLIFACV